MKLSESIRKRKTVLFEKVKEALKSVMPITAIVLLLSFTVAPVSVSSLLTFIFGAALLVIGMGLFTLGAETAMSPIGEMIGSNMTRTRRLWIVALVSLVLGIIITVCEPDLQVLANQISSVDNFLLIITVAVGVGIFLVFAMLRILFGIRLSHMLIVFYGIVFFLCIFVPKEFIAIAFDSGGVTTGPMTVPFIMALGVGVASIRSDKHAENDSFGLVALSSVGPILAVLVLGLSLNITDFSYDKVVISDFETSREVFATFGAGIPHYLKEVGISLAPIIVFFIIYNFVSLKLSKRQFLRIIFGLIYTYLGLVLFLTGTNVGFSPVGNLIGQELASLSYNWIIIPLGMLLGYFIVSAEPAVHVLNRQVEEITAGAIPSRVMNLGLSVGVCVSVGLAMVRVLTGLPIMWILIPGYLIAIGLSFFVPKIFTSIAFDSGGVASGPMATTFLLPFAMGACEAAGGNTVTDAFGIVALVAMTPLITIQIMGVIYKLRLRKNSSEQAEPAEPPAEIPADGEDIIEL